MYDARLRLSNQVVEEVRKNFQDMVFKTLINRNTKLAEAPDSDSLLSSTMQIAVDLKTICCWHKS